MAAKHSIKQAKKRAPDDSSGALVRAKVPIGESWATVFLELRAQNVDVLLTRGRKVFASHAILKEREIEPKQAPARFWSRCFKVLTTRRVWAVGAVGAIGVVACLFSTFVVLAEAHQSGTAVFESSADASPLLSTPDTPTAPAAKKCFVNEKVAEAKSADSKWTQLGGISYTQVLVKCPDESALFQIVKNLLTGDVHTVKRIT